MTHYCARARNSKVVPVVIVAAATSLPVSTVAAATKTVAPAALVVTAVGCCFSVAGLW